MLAHMPPAGTVRVKVEGGAEGEEKEVAAFDYAGFVARIFER